jgi:hypothetical protein
MKVMIGTVAFDLTDDQLADLRQQLAVDPVTAGNGWLSTAQAAELLGFSPEYVRDHAAELGGEKLTDSPKAQWRFDPANFPAGKNVAESPTFSPPRRAPRRAGSGQLLKSRG